MNARSLIVRIVSLLAIAIAPLSQAQPAQGTGIIEGRVFNPATGEYVSNAEVTVSGTSLLATTTSEGRYRLVNVPAGGATITVRYAGYPTATATVAVAAGGVLTRDFEMQSDASGRGQVVQMGAVTVEAVREGMAKALMEQRSSMVIKNVINSDTFGDMVDGNIGEVLQFVPGIDIEYGASGGAQSVISRGLGNEYTALMIDGVRTPAGTLQGNRRPEFDNVSGNMPNPELRAEHGNNYSTRLEYYFEPVGFLAAGVFWMDIKDLHLSNQLPAEELGLGSEYPGYIFTTTTNAGDVRIEGYELEYRQMLTFLPDALRGFGVFASYSTNRYSDAAIRLAITGGQPTTGSGSYGLTFRRGAFSSALRASHRPEAQSNPTTLNPPLTRVNFTADYQLSRQLALFVAGRNITGAPAFNNTSVPVEGATVTYRQHGVIWVFGVKGRL